jgi:DNA ligase-1
LTIFSELAELCETLENLSSRNDMICNVAEFLKKIHLEEVEATVRFIIGTPLPSTNPRTLEVSYRTLMDSIKKSTKTDNSKILKVFNKSGDIGITVQALFEKIKSQRQLTLFHKPLTILEVQEYFESMAYTTGAGSRNKKTQIVEALLGRSSPLEAKYVVKILLYEMRHGFSTGLMREAIASAFNIPFKTLQRADLLLSDLGLVAKIAKREGISGVEAVKITLFHPLRPMLAVPVKNVEEAISEHEGKTAFEYKADGARVQIHREASNIQIFSRRLSNVTKSLPDIVAIVKKELSVDEAIIEGEVIATNEKGEPKPFQYLMRRLRRVKDIKQKVAEIPTILQLFDVLYLAGRSLINLPYSDRRKTLRKIVGKIPVTAELVTSDPKEAEEFFEKSLKEGYEGLMAKRADSSYIPGIRGKNWLKIKKALDTLDLVVVAADYGYGYRHKWLSDYYLAALNEDTGKLEVVGKCFKGLTDEEIREMTDRLRQIQTSEKNRTVKVKPKIILEIAFSEIQKSPKYKSGFALRFARIERVRDDKSVNEVDTIRKIRDIYKKQFKREMD